MAKLSPFEQAFADARAEGKKTFSFNGKLYGTTTLDDVQKKIDAMPSMSRTTGAPVQSAGARYVTPPHTPTPSTTTARPLIDQGRDVDIYKDVDTDAVLNAGLALASLYPAGRALSVARPILGAAARSFKDSLKDFIENPPPPEKWSIESDLKPVERATANLSNQTAQEFQNNTGVENLPNTNPDKKFAFGRGFLPRTRDDFKKGGYVKAKSGKINLDACGVSTHTPSKKKHANW